MAEYANREHFIPIRKTDLIYRLCSDSLLPRADEEQFRRFCRGLMATLHCEYQARLEELKDAYEYFDPDSDTEPLETHTAAEREELIERLFDKFIALLERANFKRLSHNEVAAAPQKASEWGINLEVDFSVFERLELFARGDIVGRRTRRRCAICCGSKRSKSPCISGWWSSSACVITRPRRNLSTPSRSTSRFSRTFQRSTWRCYCPERGSS